ncbi:MAG: hypothetical protein Q8R70_03520 [Methanoregula sp.]|nr:hypothetical protein [Methanoregula sp.]
MERAIMISITCTSQANISIENHKIGTASIWANPEYQAIAAKRIEGETCYYCEIRPATLAHHDDPNSYKSREEYFKPENMTPCCGVCHEQYRKGLVICPVCRQHYMKRTSEKCGHCRGDIRISRDGKIRYHKPTAKRHPCTHRMGQQRCQRDGKLYVCAHAKRTASTCDHYQERVKA